MRGITGWISYDRDLRREQSTLDAMTRTMACRGPDAGGGWLDAHAALGHRRLAVIDPPGGAQPMTVAAAGATRLVLTYSGEAYNYRELRAELRSRGHAFRTESDTEVVLRAYLEWGAGFAERLNGMYAFALWDPRDRELLLVRDRMGVKPLYYHPTADGVLFGSEPKAILAHPGARAAVDAEGLAELVSFTKTPGHAVYRGMREVRPGHTLRVRPSGLTTHRYWALAADDYTDDLATTVERVRELLDDIIAQQLVAYVPLCTLLSGGLDSSAITALAARGLATAGQGPVRSFAVDFAGHAEHFRGDGLRPTPDGPHALAAHVGADHRDIVLDTAALTDPGHRAAVLRARGPPGRLRGRRHLAVPAVQGRMRTVHGRPLRRVGRRGLRRLPLVPLPAHRARRHLPLDGRRPRLALLQRLGRTAHRPPRPRPARQARPARIPRRPVPRGPGRSAPARRRRRHRTTPARGLLPAPDPLRATPPRPQGPHQHGRRPRGARAVLRPPPGLVRL